MAPLRIKKEFSPEEVALGMKGDLEWIAGYLKAVASKSIPNLPVVTSDFIRLTMGGAPVPLDDPSGVFKYMSDLADIIAGVREGDKLLDQATFQRYRMPRIYSHFLGN